MKNLSWKNWNTTENKTASLTVWKEKKKITWKKSSLPPIQLKSWCILTTHYNYHYYHYPLFLIVFSFYFSYVLLCVQQAPKKDVATTPKLSLQ